MNKPVIAKKFQAEMPKDFGKRPNIPQSVSNDPKDFGKTPADLLKRKIRKSLIVASEDD